MGFLQNKDYEICRVGDFSSDESGLVRPSASFRYQFFCGWHNKKGFFYQSFIWFPSIISDPFPQFLPASGGPAYPWAGLSVSRWFISLRLIYQPQADLSPFSREV
ncbi:MAG: hypothetical protein A2V65_10495 [Deltaproteobacteria bacterium RBG_13_49_15]|nr:MAG: hypothetical protein A2V65_10495 [Deltaproteobacteria bacterium RBG_13_49_15]